MATFEFDIGGKTFEVEAPDRDSALAMVLSKVGQEGPVQGQAPTTPETFRQKFAGVMGQVAEPIAAAGRGLYGITAAGRDNPATIPMAGDALAALVPRTPEGVALTAAPLLGAAGTIPAVARALPRTGAVANWATAGGKGSGVRDFTMYPALGMGAALATGGTTGEVLGAGAQGFAQAGVTATARGLQRLGRRMTGKEISARAVETQAAREIDDAARAVQGLETDLGLKLPGDNPGAKLVAAIGDEGSLQRLISQDYALMQRSLEQGLRNRSLTLPRLAAIRGDTITIPGTPGTQAAPILGPGGQQVAGGGTPGTPARQVLNTSFSPKEAMEAIKDFGSYARKSSYTAAGAPKGGEPMTGRELRLENQAVRQELVAELTRQGRPDLAARFQESSGFYAKGMDARDLLADVAKAKGLRGGSPMEGGVRAQEWLDTITEQGYEPSFPWLAASLRQGATAGARDLLRPGMEAGVTRVYAPQAGFSPRLPTTTIPVGTGPLSPRIGPVAGSALTLGVESLVKDRVAPQPLTSASPVVE